MRKLCCAILLSASTLAAGVTLDTSVLNLATQPPGTVTWTHTVGAGANSVFVVAVAANVNDALYVSSVTYAGVAMTRIAAQASVFSASVFLYAMVNPPAGANSVVVTLDGLGPYSQFGGVSWSFFGAVQSLPTNFVATSASVANPWPLSVTTTSAGDWLVGAVSSPGGSNITSGASTTLRGFLPSDGFIDSGAALGSAGTYALAANQGYAGTANWIGVALALEPVTSSGIPPAVY